MVVLMDHPGARLSDDRTDTVVAVSFQAISWPVQPRYLISARGHERVDVAVETYAAVRVILARNMVSGMWGRGSAGIDSWASGDTGAGGREADAFTRTRMRTRTMTRMMTMTMTRARG